MQFLEVEDTLRFTSNIICYWIIRHSPGMSLWFSRFGNLSYFPKVNFVTQCSEVTLNGGLIRELPQNPLNSGLGIILICPECCHNWRLLPVILWFSTLGFFFWKKKQQVLLTKVGSLNSQPSCHGWVFPPRSKRSSLGKGTGVDELMAGMIER